MAAAAAAAAAGGSPPLSHLAGLTLPGLMAATDNNGNSGSTANKEPPPLGLAGLEAFRREYLTSPLSHLRSNPNLVPQFPGLLPQLGDRSPFGKSGSQHPGSGSGARTPPTSSQSTPSSEFSSQQNWSFEEQFKQVMYLFNYSVKCNVTKVNRIRLGTPEKVNKGRLHRRCLDDITTT